MKYKDNNENTMILYLFQLLRFLNNQNTYRFLAAAKSLSYFHKYKCMR